MRSFKCHFALCAALLAAASNVYGDITGNFSLTNNLSLTSTAGDTFFIGSGNNSDLNLSSYNLTLTGSGDFDIRSHINGTGNVLIDLNDPNKTVYYRNSNTYTGTTEVRSGILFLDSPSEANNGIIGNLVIGGGPNQAVVTRAETQNKELIADTAIVTILANGKLELNRSPTGNASPHDSIETFAQLIMDGGTLINLSPNENPTTINIGTITLVSDSTLDLGEATILDITEIIPQDTNATLYIENYTTNHQIFFGEELSPQQQQQILFATDNGYVPAAQIVDGQIIPSSAVPEASTVLALPLIGGVILVYEIRRRRKAKAEEPPVTS